MKRSALIFTKSIAHLAALTPLALLLLKYKNEDLGANPVEFITHWTGDWTIYFILITLALTPLRRITGWNDATRFRRMAGLYAFFYGSLHLLTFWGIDHQFVWGEILPDVYKRPFVTAGFTAWLLMVPLALTSTAWSIRKLGGKRWNALHRLIYVTGVAAVVHYWWLVKKDITKPLEMAGILVILFGVRVFFDVRKRLLAGKKPLPKATLATGN
jgi:methionine sulfoxide reductase heme-binding subunit